MEYAGCAVVISHDRFFLDRIATNMIAFEGDQVVYFDGNFSDYEEDKKRRLGDKALTPSKTNHKKLTRA
jgi:ATPase subunit of ABC transporter with duplicated ATPase domains